MTQQNLLGQMAFPAFAIHNGGLWGSAPATAITATGQKVALIGQVWNKDHATKNISEVGFLFDTVSNTGAVGKATVFGVSTAGGFPAIPDATDNDGTHGSTATSIATGSLPASNGWLQLPLANVRQVTYGQWIAVVFELTTAGTSPSFKVAGMNIASFGEVGFGPMFSYFNGTSWTWMNLIPSLVLKFDDGTWGTLHESWPFSALAQTNFNSSTNPEVNALDFSLPCPCKIDGVFVALAAQAVTSAFNIVLYQGTTVVQTTAVDAHMASGTSVRTSFFTIPEVALLANTNYRIAIEPTTTNNVGIMIATVNDTNHFKAWPGGSGFLLNTKHSGAWVGTQSTKRPLIGLRVSAIDDGSGASGLLTHPGMLGRISA